MGKVNLVDLYSNAILVPTAVGTDDVRQLGRGTLRADAARRLAEAPVRGTAASGLGFAGLALGDSHRSSLSTERANPSHFFGFIGLEARESEFIKCSPARVHRGLAVATGLITVDPTKGAKSFAVLATERRER